MWIRLPGRLAFDGDIVQFFMWQLRWGQQSDDVCAELSCGRRALARGAELAGPAWTWHVVCDHGRSGSARS